MRRLSTALAALAIFICLGSAQAANNARLAVLGFSRDGSAFAFEQFGWSSGESYPFSELAVISTQTGRPIIGAPFQSLIAQNGATQERARLISYTAAQKLLADLAITQPGAVVARASGNPRDPAARSLEITLPSLGPVRIKLDSAVVKSLGCDAAGVKVRALAIRLLDPEGRPLRTLHKEKNPPPERLCPVGYGLAEVRIFERGDALPVMAIIIGMDRPGAGGSDRRYLGIVVDLAEPEPSSRHE
jgi:predicted secreted protein